MVLFFSNTIMLCVNINFKLTPKTNRDSLTIIPQKRQNQKHNTAFAYFNSNSPDLIKKKRSQRIMGPLCHTAVCVFCAVQALRLCCGMKALMATTAKTSGVTSVSQRCTQWDGALPAANPLYLLKVSHCSRINAHTVG